MTDEAVTNDAGRLRGALLLIISAVLAAILLAGLNQLTASRIAANVAAEQLRALRAVLAAGSYDNEPHLDAIRAQNPDLLGSPESLPVYRARLGTKPVAAVLTVVAPNGFAGEIRLLVAVGTNGQLSGVRVIEHTETPGLGDKIEAEKSGWILRFQGLDTRYPASADWTLKRDAGNFDQISGATVTSRAVLMAARNAVVYFAANQDEIFAPQKEPLTGLQP